MRLLVGVLLILSVAARVDPRGDAHAALTLLASEPAASATADDTTASAASVPQAAARPLIGVVAMPGTSPGGVHRGALLAALRVRAPAIRTGPYSAAPQPSAKIGLCKRGHYWY
jgi:hypothetical protein